MGLAALERGTDLHEERGAVFLDKRVLPLFRGQARVLVFQLLGGDERDIGGVQGQVLQLGEHGVEVHLGGADSGHDGANHVFQIRLGAVLLPDDLFPVPLVHIDGVEVVQFLVPADGVHITVQALAHPEAVILEGLALPLCQRLDHLCFNAAVFHIEGDFPLDAVQVVVQAGRSLHEERRGHAVEIQRGAQGVGKQPLHRANGALGVVQVQRGRVVCGNDRFAHKEPPLFALPAAECRPGSSFPFNKINYGTTCRRCKGKWAKKPCRLDFRLAPRYNKTCKRTNAFTRAE